MDNSISIEAGRDLDSDSGIRFSAVRKSCKSSREPPPVPHREPPVSRARRNCGSGIPVLGHKKPRDVEKNLQGRPQRPTARFSNVMHQNSSLQREQPVTLCLIHAAIKTTVSSITVPHPFTWVITFLRLTLIKSYWIPIVFQNVLVRLLKKTIGLRSGRGLWRWKTSFLKPNRDWC